MQRLLGLSLLLLSTLPTLALGVGTAPRVKVLAVGVNDSFSPSVQSLKFAEEDAQRFVEAMRSVGFVPDLNATLLKRASIADLRGVLDAEVARSGKDEQKFIFYFSGHSDDQGLHLRDGLFSKKLLHEYLTRLKANTKIAILDSCFSGALSMKGIEKSPAFELPHMEFDEPAGSVFMTASSWKQMAFESDSLRGSVFTHHLLTGLYGEADGNTDGIVTIDELYQYVYRNTKLQNLNYPTSARQEPTMVTKLQGQGAVAVSFPAQNNTGLILDKDIGGEVTIASVHGLQIFKVQKELGAEKQLRLPGGDFSIAVREGQFVGEMKLNLQQDLTRKIARKDLRYAAIGNSWLASKGYEPSMEIQEDSPSSAPLTPQKMSYGFGVHAGFAHQSTFGPYFEINFSHRQLYAATNQRGSIYGQCSYNQNPSANTGRNFTLSQKIHSLGCYAQARLSYRYHSWWLPNNLGWNVGVGQTLHYNNYENDGPAFAPGLRLGVSSALSNKVSVSAELETISVNLSDDAAGTRKGGILATQYTF